MMFENTMDNFKFEYAGLLVFIGEFVLKSVGLEPIKSRQLLRFLYYSAKTPSLK